MAAMKQNRAFNFRMMTQMIHYAEGTGYYNDNNDYVKEPMAPSTFWGVSVAGNKFSQFDEGIARKSMTGGERFSNYRSLYVETQWPSMAMGAVVDYKGILFNVLQKSDEVEFGFNSYLLEQPEHPPTIQLMLTANGANVTANTQLVTV